MRTGRSDPPTPRATLTLRVQMNAGHPKICKLEMADYEECLHRRKLVRHRAAAASRAPPSRHDHAKHRRRRTRSQKQRVAEKLMEVQRQAQESKAPAGGHGGH